MNIGVVSNFLPATGISLPFFSYGGTALWVNLAEMGIILGVSRQNENNIALRRQGGQKMQSVQKRGSKMRVIFTCGGTGGHINPAIAVAKLLQSRSRHCEILFIGAVGGWRRPWCRREGFCLETLKDLHFSAA